VITACRILFEDNHLVVVSKRCGEITQGDRTGDPTLGDYISSYIKERDSKPGNVFLAPVHRLDRPVSGVAVFAKTSKATSRMNALFRTGAVEKRYWAIVAEPPVALEGSVVHYLVRNAKLNKSFAVDAERDGAKRCELFWKTLATSNRFVLLEIRIETGRHHQIRAQLAAMGSPIRGDLKYGFRRSNPGGGISLHARSVAFEHPVAPGRVEIVAPVPADDRLWMVFESMIDGGKAAAF
jgi:23S rRNA pseudouridine1911/1915/1917 synthase